MTAMTPKMMRSSSQMRSQSTPTKTWDEISEIQHQINLKRLYLRAAQNADKTTKVSGGQRYIPSSTRLVAMQEISKMRNKLIRQYDDKEEVERLNEQTNRITATMKHEYSETMQKYKTLSHFNQQMKKQEENHIQFEKEILAVQHDKARMAD